MSPIKNAIRRVRLAMAEQQISQHGLAERMGIHYTTLNRSLNHPEAMTIARLEEIGGMLGLSLRDLFAPNVSDAEAASPGPGGFADDAIPYTPEPGEPLDAFNFPENAFLYRAETDALDNVGIGRGTLLLADVSEAEVSPLLQGKRRLGGVLAQWQPDPDGEVYTILRYYVYPNVLVRMSSDGRVAPLITTKHHVTVLAVITMILQSAQ